VAATARTNTQTSALFWTLRQSVGKGSCRAYRERPGPSKRRATETGSGPRGGTRPEKLFVWLSGFRYCEVVYENVEKQTRVLAVKVSYRRPPIASRNSLATSASACSIPDRETATRLASRGGRAFAGYPRLTRFGRCSTPSEAKYPAKPALHCAQFLQGWPASLAGRASGRPPPTRTPSSRDVARAGRHALERQGHLVRPSRHGAVRHNGGGRAGLATDESELARFSETARANRRAGR
jgi:hypothetical protein